MGGLQLGLGRGSCALWDSGLIHSAVTNPSLQAANGVARLLHLRKGSTRGSLLAVGGAAAPPCRMESSASVHEHDENHLVNTFV